MSYLDWHVGMKVVCVDARIKNTFVARLTENETYTIRAMFVSPTSGKIGVRLVGIANGIHRSGIERGYRASRFRPLVTRKTDISIFTAMLHGTDQVVDA